MAITYLDQKGANTGAAAFALSADLAIGSSAGRAIVGVGNINNAVTGLVATAEGGDVIPVVAGPYTGLSGSVPLSVFGALVPTGDASQNVNFTSTSGDGPNKWIRMAAFSGAAALRAQDPLTDHVFVGIGPFTRTFDTQPGDVIVVLGDDGVISGRLLTISNAGAVVVSNEVEFLAYVPAASSGSTTTVNFNVSGGGGNCQFGVVVLVPISVAPVITGPSGAAGAGSSTANLAENTTSGPVFSVSGSMSSPYPRITGTDAGLFTLVDQGSGSYRVDKLVAGNYEAPDDAGANRVYNFVFEASVSVSQSHALTLTDVNEAPTHVGPAIGAQVFTVGVPITPINIASRFTDPEGLAITGSIVQSLPAGLSVVAGQLQGTPSAAQASASYTPRGADPAGNGTNGTAFTIAINADVVTYSALTDIIGEAGIALASGTTVYWTWFPSGRPGALANPVQGSGAVNAQGRATISHNAPGDGFVIVGRRPGPAVVNDRVFAQFLTLA